MKIENHKINGDGEPEDAGQINGNIQQNVDNLLDDILAQFSSGNNLPVGSYTNGSANTNELENLDEALNLQDSIANKCVELQEILRTLRTRLNQVVVDTNVMLSPEADPLDAQFAHDLDTDCQEDISLPEFLEILNNQNNQSKE